MIFQQHLILFYIGTFFSLFFGVFCLLVFLDNRQKMKDPVPREYPAVSVIIPAYNEEKSIARTISSALALRYPSEIEVIVVDDGSHDKTYEIAKSFEKRFENGFEKSLNSRVRVIRKVNGGKSSALNVGIKAARHEFIAVLDADSFVSRNALKNMVGYFENKNVVSVTPTLKVYRPRGFWQRVQYVEYLFGVFFRKLYAFIGSIYVTPGPFTLYRKSFFRNHGYFAKNNITEDLEIALRIQKHNYEIQNSINADVYTVTPHTFRGLFRQRVRWATGFIDNVYAYRGLFSARHGNLGLFALPVVIIGNLIALAYIFYYGYFFAADVVQKSYNAYLINFDILPVLQNFQFNLLSFISPIFFLVAITLTFSLFWLFLAKVYAREKKRIEASFVFYILTYGLLFGFWWTMTLLNKILNIKVKW